MNKDKVATTLSFIILGTVFGGIYLYLSDWDLVEFITDPTTLLILLIAFSGLVFWWSFK